jgi:hypothetical protein
MLRVKKIYERLLTRKSKEFSKLQDDTVRLCIFNSNNLTVRNLFTHNSIFQKANWEIDRLQINSYEIKRKTRKNWETDLQLSLFSSSRRRRLCSNFFVSLEIIKTKGRVTQKICAVTLSHDPTVSATVKFWLTVS